MRIQSAKKPLLYDRCNKGFFAVQGTMLFAAASGIFWLVIVFVIDEHDLHRLLNRQPVLGHLGSTVTELCNFDGNGDGIPGDDYVFASAATPSAPTNIFRIFGDINGDGTVAANDFIVFRQYFGGYLFALDFDSDGAVAASDFIQFRLRFGGSI